MRTNRWTAGAATSRVSSDRSVEGAEVSDDGRIADDESSRMPGLVSRFPTPFTPVYKRLKNALKRTLLAQHHRDATLPKQLDSSSRHACDSPFQP